MSNDLQGEGVSRPFMGSPPQEEIINNWDPSIKEPVVSITCITFNHENYIRNALDGFLSQITNFPFEVLVHDDASTDNTQAILAEYEEAYPDIVRVVYQKENQYSQGVKVSATFLTPLVRGYYIAICEGDDYWIDDKKLQSQVNIMRENPQLGMSIHDAYLVGNDIKSGRNRLCGDDQECIMKSDTVLERGVSFIPTCSMLVKADIAKKYNEFRKTYGTSFLMKFLASQDGCHYSPKVASAYRVESENSHTSRVKKDDELKLKYLFSVNEAFDHADNLTEHRYHSAILSLQYGRLQRFMADDVSLRLKIKAYLHEQHRHTSVAKLKLVNSAVKQLLKKMISKKTFPGHEKHRATTL